MSASGAGPRSPGVTPLALLRLDADRYYETAYSGRRSPTTRVRLWLLNPEFRCVASYRLRQAAQELSRRNRLLGLVPLVLTGLLRHRVFTVRHVHLSRDAVIGPGLTSCTRTGSWSGRRRSATTACCTRT